MTPGVNDGPRNTGTLPKSNRRNDRNREPLQNSHQQPARPSYHGRPQHSNNLLDWQPVSDREPVRTKNSNTRSTSTAPKIFYQDLADIVYGGSRQYNYPGEDSQWQEMALPVDSRAQTPPHIQAPKPTNVDRMPERSQVESRLNQIRDYIRVTSTMMESLSQSSDPRARIQHDKLSRMVEDLCDSETKLAKLLEDYRGPVDETGDHIHQSQCSNHMKRFTELLDILSSQEHCLVTSINHRNGEGADSEDSLESQLRKKMEVSQQKLVQLQEHQANLVGMQLRVRERLTEARQAQQALLLQENQAPNISSSTPGWESSNRSDQQSPNDAEVLESETAVLRGKLAALQNKKKQMDNLVAELQAVEMSDRASCSSESSRNAERDKAIELETLKHQLAHLKGLMEEATRVRDTFNPTPELEAVDSTANAVTNNNGEVHEEEVGVAESYNSFDRSGEVDETYVKFGNSKERLTVDQIHAVTRELREQQALLQAARAELRRLKNPMTPPPASAASSTSALFLQGSTPPSSMLGSSCADKKPSNNSSCNNVMNEDTQSKKRQFEELVRKDQSQSSSVNRGNAPDWSSRRGSNSQFSHTSTPANIWPASNPTAGESNEPSIDGVSTTDNLLDIGPQITTVENGFGANWWNAPIPPINQPPHVGNAGSIEYYRQLLMGSQAQQLQMMSTTMQQCCQLLWTQQRELHSMRVAITDIQQQFRQSQPRQGNVENREDYSNLSRSSTHHLGNTLDAALPPSSSLPNLVSLPNSSSAPSHPPIAASATTQHHQQLNNQVPPGNRANNYWDNFRSYSRQNLLSGNPKTVIDSPPGPSGMSSISTNTTAASVHTPLVRDKRNREHGTDNLSLPSVTTADGQYSLNLQLQSNLQSQERDMPAARNILANEASYAQQMENFWEDANSIFRSVPDGNEDVPRHLSGEIRDVLLSLVSANKKRPDFLVIILREIKAISEDHRLRPRLLRSLRALHDTQLPTNPLNETTDQTASESCQSSDEDSEAGAQASPLLYNSAEQQSLLPELPPPPSSLAIPQSMPALLVDHFEFEGAAQLDDMVAMPPMASLTPGYNEDLAEADQTRPEASNNQNSVDDCIGGTEENGEFHGSANAAALEADREMIDGDNGNIDGSLIDNSALDRIPTRLLHN